MAINSVKGLNVVPGVYQKEVELTPPSSSVSGVTALGLVGETLSGPAFSPIYITNAGDFAQIFGGTSTEVYSGSKYPRYELPYIAKDYLANANQLYVTRVLGLSGTCMGKGWCIRSAGCGEGNNMLVGIIRSRGKYVETYGTPRFSDKPVESGFIEKYVQYVVGRVVQEDESPIPHTDYINYDGTVYRFGQKFYGSGDAVTYAKPNDSALTVYGYCGTNYEYDKFIWDVTDVWIAPPGVDAQYFTCGKSGAYGNIQQSAVPSTPEDFGTFRLVCRLTEGGYETFDVSFNPGDKKYIYNVLGSDPLKGNTPIFVEELYDVALQQLVYKNGVDPLDYITGIYIGEQIVKVIEGGYNYTKEPEVTIKGDGTGATAIAKIDSVVKTVKLINGGSGYSSVPEVIVHGTGSGANITATINASVEQIDIISPGGGYQSNPTIEFIGGGGSGAEATATISGPLESVVLTNPGTGYSTPPTVTISGGGGSGAVVTAEISGSVSTTVAPTITNGGSGYTKAPQVVFTGDGTGATAVATIDGFVETLTLTNGGTGYTDNPTVEIYSQTGSGATATAYVEGGMTGIYVVNPGSGYKTKPVVEITSADGYGSGAVAEANISGHVDVIILENGGDGYTTRPIVEIVGDGTGAEANAIIDSNIGSISVTNGGSGYTEAPELVINNTSGGSGAVITSHIKGGVDRVNVVTAGYGFTSIPQVTLVPVDGEGTGATAKAVLETSLFDVIINNPGTNYKETPVITIEPPKPLDFATAHVTLGNGAIKAVTIDYAGNGYTSPPNVRIKGDGEGATAQAVVAGGEISEIIIVSRGLNYTYADVEIGSPTPADAATATITVQNGVVTNIEVIDGGSGYTEPPTITIGGNGTGATAEAFLAGDKVSLIKVITGGSGYSSAPAIGIAPPVPDPIDTTVLLANGVITTVYVTNAGYGYDGTSTVEVVGDGNGAVLGLDIDSNGSVVGIDVIEPGYGYTTATITFNPGTSSGSGAVATAQIKDGVINEIRVLGSPKGYVTAPNVYVNGGSETATATAVVTNGVVTKIYLGIDSTSKWWNFGGSGYGDGTSVDFTGGGGVPATAASTITDGLITSVTITNEGDGYHLKPEIVFTGGTGAVAEAIVEYNRVTHIELINGGSGYNQLSTIEIVGGAGNPALASVEIGTGVVTHITVDNGGDGYTQVPEVQIIGGGGYEAEAVAILEGGHIVGIDVIEGGFCYTDDTVVNILGGIEGETATVVFNEPDEQGRINGGIITNPGSGYTGTPNYTITGGNNDCLYGGPDECLDVTLIMYTYIKQIDVLTPGEGYTQSPTVVISGGGGGEPATATAVLDAVFDHITVVEGGTGYDETTTVSIVGGGGSGATAVVNIRRFVKELRLTKGGSKYTSTPDVVISGGGGTGAAGSATINSFVDYITLTHKGSGYKTPPVVTIVSETGSGAYALAEIDTSVTSITLVTAGSGYETNPTVSIIGGGGSGATAEAIINGTVTSVVVVNGGTGYTQAPAVSFQGGGGGSGAAATVTVDAGLTGFVVSEGGNYTSVPTVTISGGGGTGAIAEAIINGMVTGIVIENIGNGYKYPPQISITGGGGSGAYAEVSIAGYVDSITLHNGGTGYTTVPAIVFSGGGGSGAAATATVAGAVVGVIITKGGTGYTHATVEFRSKDSGYGAVAIIEDQDILNNYGVLDRYDGLVVRGEQSPIRSKFKPVDAVLSIPAQLLVRGNVGERYLFVNGESAPTEYFEAINGIAGSSQQLGPDDDGKILVVDEYETATGKKAYRYLYDIIEKVDEDDITTRYVERLDPNDTMNDGYTEKYVYVTDQDLYYTIDKVYPTPTDGRAITITQRVVGDVTDYRETYRYASTPWVVSQMLGTYGSNDVKKLFRFHTINEGSDVNTSIKISLMNIRPTTGQFDIIVRPFNDNDNNPIPLETYVGLTMNPDSSNFIASRIGSFDNTYPRRSSRIVVEVADNETIRYMFPAGFLGYPVRDLGQSYLQKPSFAFNTSIDEQIRPKKQFFGVSEFLGIDTDLITYKGKSTYTDGYWTDGFHLDSRVNNINTTVDGENPLVEVIGELETSTMNCGFDSYAGRYYKYYNDEYYFPGIYTWQTPSIDLKGPGDESPYLTSELDTTGTIYEDINYRKFTMAFYGAYDGWDEFRTERTTGNNFKRNTYKGVINTLTGEGSNFKILRGGDLDIPETAITSDFYAFWAGYRTFNNNSLTPVTIFATPGIDLINQSTLVGEATDIVEEDLQNAIYVATLPDKPKGNGDTVSEMYTEEEIADLLETTEVDTSYVATYYPWARYYDNNDGKYIFLPVTRDVIKAFAVIDNTSFVHMVPAGVQYGRVDGNTQFLRKKLKVAGENTLQTGRINFVKSFASDGNFLWGQKTLKVSYYEDKEPLTRISARRIMNYLKYTVQRSVKGLLFTPNNQAVVTAFKSIVGQILSNVASNGSIYGNYIIKVDDSTEARQARSLPAVIYVMPYNLLEYIEIEWNITPEGTDMSSF